MPISYLHWLLLVLSLLFQFVAVVSLHWFLVNLSPAVFPSPPDCPMPFLPPPACRPSLCGHPWKCQFIHCWFPLFAQFPKCSSWRPFQWVTVSHFHSFPAFPSCFPPLSIMRWHALTHAMVISFPVDFRCFVVGLINFGASSGNGLSYLLSLLNSSDVRLKSL